MGKNSTHFAGRNQFQQQSNRLRQQRQLPVRVSLSHFQFPDGFPARQGRFFALLFISPVSARALAQPW
jgi:hypothetical protein